MCTIKIQSFSIEIQPFLSIKCKYTENLRQKYQITKRKKSSAHRQTNKHSTIITQVKGKQKKRATHIYAQSSISYSVCFLRINEIIISKT